MQEDRRTFAPEMDAVLLAGLGGHGQDLRPCLVSLRQLPLQERNLGAAILRDDAKPSGRLGQAAGCGGGANPREFFVPVGDADGDSDSRSLDEFEESDPDWGADLFLCSVVGITTHDYWHEHDFRSFKAFVERYVDHNTRE